MLTRYNWLNQTRGEITPNVFASAHPLVAHKLSRMRNKDIEPKKFRELVREIAALLCYEATSDLLTVPRQVETPLATMTGSELQEKIGLVPILRAGLGMVEGVWELMPVAEVWHIELSQMSDSQTGGILQQTAHRADRFRLPYSRPDAGHRRLSRRHR